MDSPPLKDHSTKKKVHFISLGCPKNLVDTEMMLGSLTQEGYELTENESEAEAIVINTCGFIGGAKEESIRHILDASELKKKGSLKRLLVAGCLTQRYKEELLEALPEADALIGSGEFQNIAHIMKEIEEGTTTGRSKLKSFFHKPTFLQQDSTPRLRSGPKHMAYLKISEGCKKRCAFCAIPHIRGNLQSRTLDGVVSEAKLLVASGVKELIVISHDFTDYGWDLRRKNHGALESPKELLRRLSDESGAQWIRVLYLYPDGIDQELVELVKERPNLVNYFDIPLQHINNDMLKSMNRRMTRQQIEEALQIIRKEIPHAVIRTQFIVGFPGETEESFQELLDFVEEQKFDRVGGFKYSREEGTKAHNMDHQVSEEIKSARYEQLMTLQRKISRQKHRSFVGKTLSVIIEGLSKETDLLLKGRFSLQAPEIDGVTYINSGEANIGDIVPVLITDSHDYDLVGEIVET